MPIRPVLPILLLTSLLSSTAMAAGHSSSAPARQPAAPPAAAKPFFPVDASHFLVGLIAARADDYAVAAQSYAAALKADPDNRELLRQTFTEAALAGSSDAPALAAQMLKQPGGKSILTAFVLGNDAIQHSRWKEAAQIYSGMPADALTAILTPLLQAWCLAGEKKYTEAVDLLTSPGRRLSPAMPFYTAHAALIATMAGDMAKAKTLYDRATVLLPGSDLLTNRAHANFLWQTGHQTEARDLLRAATGHDTVLSLAEPELQEAIDTPPISSAQNGIAHAYILVAFILRQQALHAPETDSMQQINVAAAMMLRMALTLDPSSGIARLMLAEIEESLEHRDVAISILQDVAPTDPLTRVAQYSQALLESQTGDRANARKTFERLSHDAPTLVLPVRALGTLLMEDKDWAGAATAFSKAIDNARADHALDWSLLFERAAAYERLNDWTRAEADLQEARQMVPDEPLILNFLGYGWVQRGIHTKEAAALLQRALSLDPDNAAVRDSLGWATLRDGDLQRGTELIERAAEQTPLDPEVNYHLGVAYWDLGRKTEAVDQWNVALGLKPEADDKERIENALRFAQTHDASARFPIQNTP